MRRAQHTDTKRRRVLGGLVPSVLGLGLAALLAGCGSGQITQTDTQSAAINGANGMTGAIAVRDAQLAYPAGQGGVYQPGTSASLIVSIVNTGRLSDTLVKVTSPAATQVTVDGSASGTKTIPGGFLVSSGTDQDDVTAQAAARTQATDQPGVTATPTAPASSTTSPASGSPASGTGTPSTTASRPGSGPSAGPSSQASANPVTPVGRVTIMLTALRSINGGPLRPGLTIPVTFYFAHAGQVTLDVPIGAPSDNQFQAAQAAPSSSNG